MPKTAAYSVNKKPNFIEFYRIIPLPSPMQLATSLLIGLKSNGLLRCYHPQCGQLISQGHRLRGCGKTLFFEGYGEGYGFFEGYGLPRRSEHQPVYK